MCIIYEWQQSRTFMCNVPLFFSDHYGFESQSPFPAQMDFFLALPPAFLTVTYSFSSYTHINRVMYYIIVQIQKKNV